MGLSPVRISRSSFDYGSNGRPNAIVSGNPDPSNYSIEKLVQINRNVVVLIRYHDCTNYEGLKVLVFRNTTATGLMKQKVIDPHFSNNKKFISPFARFEPTDYGWLCAVKLAESL